ncbi:hypothetical protein J3Q64DRAFT_1704399 [Phycomyces blakesleeanus]|uniref:C2H2-type domain-containing protein n=1 Tax=Phycomyces blakesleeanus TaxID=4837 RepID=A0ABR3AK32_PHYBL
MVHRSILSHPNLNNTLLNPHILIETYDNVSNPLTPTLIPVFRDSPQHQGYKTYSPVLSPSISIPEAVPVLSPDPSISSGSKYQAGFIDDIVARSEYAYIIPISGSRNVPLWQCINIKETFLHENQALTTDKYTFDDTMYISEPNALSNNPRMELYQDTYLPSVLKVSQQIDSISTSNLSRKQTRFVNFLPESFSEDRNHRIGQNTKSRKNQSLFRPYSQYSMNKKKRKLREECKRIYDCDKCNYWSDRRGNLKRHSAHHDKSVKKAKCPTCKKKFSSKFNVQRHVSSSFNTCKSSNMSTI